MRKSILYVMAMLFTIAGLSIGGGGISAGLAGGNDGDIVAGVFLGGCLLAIGLILFYLARRMARRRAQPLDMDTVTAVGMAHAMNLGDEDGDVPD